MKGGVRRVGSVGEQVVQQSTAGHVGEVDQQVAVEAQQVEHDVDDRMGLDQGGVGAVDVNTLLQPGERRPVAVEHDHLAVAQGPRRAALRPIQPVRGTTR